MYNENYVNYVLRTVEIEKPMEFVKQQTRFLEKIGGICHIYNKIMNKELSLVPIKIDR